MLCAGKRTTNTKTDKFIVATNGKKLCRVKSTKETSGNFTMKTISGTKLLTNISQKVNYKNNIRYTKFDILLRRINRIFMLSFQN